MSRRSPVAASCAARARAVEILPHPGMVGGFDLRQRRVHHHLLVGQHGHPVADSVKRVEIMCDDENGQPQRLSQRQDEFIESRRADRVQSGGRLVQEKQWRVQRDRPRQPGTLAHAARQLRRELVDGIGRQTGEFDLQQGQFIAQIVVEGGVVLLQRHFHILADRQRGEQRAVLEQHAGVALDGEAVLPRIRARIDPHHLDLAFVGRAQAQDRAHQHRLAGARAPDHAQDLAAADVQVQPVVHHLLAEAVDQPAHAHGHIAIFVPAGLVVLGRGRCVFHLTNPCA